MRNSIRCFMQCGLAASGAGVLVLAGCAVGPDFVTPAPPPVEGYLPDRTDRTHATLERGAQISAQWWEGFRSRPLNQLIDDAIKNKDEAKFTESYGHLTDACNACHQAALQTPVVIQDPKESMFPDQDFRSK